MKHLLRLAALLAAVAVLSAAPLAAQPPAAAPAPLSDTAALRAFADSVLGAARARHGVPGAVVAIVRDTAVVYLGGVGMADVEAGRPVDPQRTLFRLASISKVVSATAILQLVEEGVLDLDADIGTYLGDLAIPATQPGALTLRHLLTHTGGFDDRFIGKSRLREESAAEFGAFVRGFMPARVTPPGRVSTYSNYGIALAAYAAQEATGQDFEVLVRTRVFQPLGMQRSAFRLQRGAARELAVGYVEEGGRVRRMPFYWIRDYPAGQAMTTAAEFSRFMIAHLNEGAYRDARILRPATARAMQQVQFTHHPALAGGMGWAFIRSARNGRLLLAHDGGFPGMRTRMWLFPEARIGVFIAANLMHEGFLWDVTNPLVDRLLPAPPTSPAAAHGSAALAPRAGLASVRRFAGSYRGTRYPRATFGKAGLLMGAISGEMPIRLAGDGMIEMPDHLGRPRRLVQTEPGLFRSVDDDYTLAFAQNAAGRVTYAFTDGVTALERIRAYETVAFSRRFFLFAQLAFLSVLAALTVRAGRRAAAGGEAGLMRSARRLVAAVAALFLAHSLALSVVLGALTPAEELLSGFGLGASPALRAALALSWLALAGLAALALVYLRALLRRSLPWRAALGYGGLLGLFAAYALFLDYWKLLGWRF